MNTFRLGLSIGLVMVFASASCWAGSMTPDKATKDHLNMTMASIRNGKLENVQKFVESHPIDWMFLVDDDGLTLLHKAAGHGQMGILRYLLSKDSSDISLQMRNKRGETPLDMARRFNHADIVRLLEAKLQELGMAQGAGTSVLSQDKSLKDYLNMTMASIRNGRLENVQKFVEANPSRWMLLADDDGLTLMHKAAGHGQMGILRYLLSKDRTGRTLQIRNGSGETPLDMARNFGHDDIVRLLEAKHQELNVPTGIATSSGL